MINFRYHVVTLVAVFLALGLGVLFGASFIDQKTVSGLQASQQRLGQRNSVLRQEVLALQKERDSLRSFAVSSRDLLIRDSLTNRAVVIIAFQSSDDGLVRDIEDTLVKAGSSLRGSIRLSDDLDLKTEQRRRNVASALGGANDANTVGAAIVQGLTDSFAGRQRGYLQNLIDAGLASAAQPSGSQPQPPADIADPGTSVVLLPPGSKEAAQRTLLVPLVRSLASAAVPTAVAQAETGPFGLISAIREQDGLPVVTVDQADNPMGQAALALGLQAALAGDPGHYGTREGATSLLPSPQSLAAA